jgi:hypothetical protein
MKGWENESMNEKADIKSNGNSETWKNENMNEKLNAKLNERMRK